MVIQCPECRTRFKLADEKIGPDGVKVRCARCKHVFAVQSAPPPASEERMDPALVFAQEDPGPSSPPPAAEEVWAELPPQEKPAPSTAEVPNPDLFEEEPPRDPFGDDPFGSDPFAEAPPPGPAAEETGAEDVSWQPAVEESASPATEEREGETEEFEIFEAHQEKEPFSFMASSPEPETDAFSFDGGDSETFGITPDDSSDRPERGWGGSEGGEALATAEKDEFDFSGATFAEQTPAPIAQEPPAPALAEIPRAVPPPIAPAPPPVAPVPKPDAAEKKHAAPLKSGKPVSGLLVFLIVLLLVLAGVAGFIYLSGGPEKMAETLQRYIDPPVPAPAPSPIRLIDLKGVFVQNTHEGQLFAISGQAVNDHPEARSAVELKGILYDGKGQPVLQQTVFAGNPLSEATLRQAPFAKIEERMSNQFGDSLSNLNVAPGKSIPFTIVFKGLPPDVTEFTVEVADSRPGSK